MRVRHQGSVARLGERVLLAEVARALVQQRGLHDVDGDAPVVGCFVQQPRAAPVARRPAAPHGGRPPRRNSGFRVQLERRSRSGHHQSVAGHGRAHLPGSRFPERRHRGGNKVRGQEWQKGHARLDDGRVASEGALDEQARGVDHPPKQCRGAHRARVGAARRDAVHIFQGRHDHQFSRHRGLHQRGRRASQQAGGAQPAELGFRQVEACLP
mmetsp:Transcript_32370/g.97805  ORF Transcript_32370/g.97805 Transcript_32370/m.97805 type:complete len:212 (-) Transcript_32370:299-934(-)